MIFNYFLAIILEPHIKQEVIKCGLPSDDPRLQHTTPLHNLHITVGYIGPILDEVLPQVSSCFKSLETLPCFDLFLAGVDFFGSRANFKRYIGMTLKDPEEKIHELHRYAQGFLQKETSVSFRVSHKEFKPHITFQLLKRKLTAFERKELTLKPQPPLQLSVKTLGLWYRNPKTQLYESVCNYKLKE